MPVEEIVRRMQKTGNVNYNKGNTTRALGEVFKFHADMSEKTCGSCNINAVTMQKHVIIDNTTKRNIVVSFYNFLMRKRRRADIPTDSSTGIFQAACNDMRKV